MSTPVRQIRQPGRTGLGHNKWSDCGACKGGMPSALFLRIAGMQSCVCSLGFDDGHAYVLEPDTEANCINAKTAATASLAFCTYRFQPPACNGANFLFRAQISCFDAGDGLRVHFDLLLFWGTNPAGDEHLFAQGEWESDVVSSCGDFDCTFPDMIFPSGTLTLFGPDGIQICNPATSTATWSLETGEPAPCDQPGHKNCCCGGKPPPPCYFVCFKQTAGTPCCFAFADMALCYNPAAGCYGGTSEPGSCDSSMTGSLCYDKSSKSWSFTWSCGGDSQTVPLSSSKSGGSLSFSASGVTDMTGCCESDAVFDISIGKQPPCYLLPPPEGGPQCPKEVLVTIPDFFFTADNSVCKLTGSVGGDYILELDGDSCSYSLVLPSIVTCCPPEGDLPVPDGTRITASGSTVDGVTSVTITLEAGGSGAIDCIVARWVLIDAPGNFCFPSTFSVPFDAFTGVTSNCTGCFNVVNFSENAGIAPGACP